MNFGDRPGRVVEVTDNLITVMAPAREDILHDTIVDIIVSNKFARGELYSADKKLNFTYSTTPTDIRFHAGVHLDMAGVQLQPQ